MQRQGPENPKRRSVRQPREARAARLISVDRAIARVDFDGDEWKGLIDDFFSNPDSVRMLRSGLRAIHEPGTADNGWIIKDVADYTQFELYHFGHFLNIWLKKRIEELSGTWVMPDTPSDEKVAKRQGEIAQKQDREHFYTAQCEAHKRMIADLGWEDDVLAHLDRIYKLVSVSDRIEHYTPLVAKQLGWEYHFQNESSQVRNMFAQGGLDVGDDIDHVNAFTNFVVDLIQEHAEQELREKLGEVVVQYGEDTADIVLELFADCEIERILTESEGAKYAKNRT